MARNSVYFPNLNGVRFIAALAVIIHHIELTKYWFGQPNIYTTSFVGGVFGQLGIILFFVLSGFLITFLLLEENKQKDKISIKRFYIRRMLRIWPLYYLIVLLGLFILPNIHFFDIPEITTHVKEHFISKSAMFLSFFPNVAYAMYDPIPYSEQAWSVGVEEQFYLVWPVLIALVVRKFRTINMLLTVIVTYLLIKVSIVYAYSVYPDNIIIEKLYQFWTHFAIDCMAIGGVGAYILFYKKDQILNVLFNKYLQIALYIALVYITVRGIAIPVFNSEFYAVIFIVLILNLAANKNTLLNLDYKPLNYLGKISFGLYMFHNIILVLVLRLMLFYSKDVYSSLTGNVIYYVLSILFTVVIAGVSYRFFEKPFIRAKIRYSTVISGENAADNTDTTQDITPEIKL